MRKRGAALRAAQEEEGSEAGPGSSPGLRGTDAAPTPAPLDHSTQLMTGFTPVPRKYRFDGWTPERQRAFIEALADTGCVDRAARMVNMAQANCYTLRRAPGAEEFRRAWDAALDFGVKRLKDVAFSRAIEGELVPVFVGGKLIGFRRKYNDKLLMFCLRHYGEDANGRRVTVNYFSTRATTSSGQASAAAGAEASTTTVRTVIAGPGVSTGLDTNGERLDTNLDEAAAVLNGFEGVALDAEAAAAIRAALEDCAARARARDQAYEAGGVAAEEAGEEDPEQLFFRSRHPYRGTLIPPPCEEWVPFAPGEAHWTEAGAAMPDELARALEAAEEAEGQGRSAEGEESEGARRGKSGAGARSGGGD